MLRKSLANRFFQLHDYALQRQIGRVNLWLYRRMYESFSYGSNMTAWGWTQIRIFHEGRIHIGDDCRIISSRARCNMSLYTNTRMTAFGAITLGRNVSLHGTVITCKKAVTIGDDVMIAPNVVIVDSDFHALWPPEARWRECPEDRDAPVVIGDNVWIGTGALVLKGVTIGDGAVVAAGSVVVRDVPENTLAAGNPAKEVRRLDRDPDCRKGGGSDR